MIEGVLRHGTEMEVERQYVDSHGQSEVAFAFCRLLGFELMPRLKGIHRQRLYRPDSREAYANLELVMVSRSINWELIEQQLDAMVKHAVALKIGMTDAESILRRFTRCAIPSGWHSSIQTTVRYADHLELAEIRVHMPRWVARKQVGNPDRIS